MEHRRRESEPGQASGTEERFSVPPLASCGRHVIIEPDVLWGPGCRLGHRVILKRGTRLGKNVVMKDCVVTTGQCWIGDNVDIRTGAIISKGTVIEPNVFIGPGVITNHTKHVFGPFAPDENLMSVIESGAIIGSGVVILAGVRISGDVVIGAGSVVTKDVLEPGVYVGNPLRRLK